MTDNQHTDEMRGYWLKQFVKTEGKALENEWQLMQYAEIMEKQSKGNTFFSKGVFVL